MIDADTVGPFHGLSTTRISSCPDIQNSDEGSFVATYKFEVSSDAAQYQSVTLRGPQSTPLLPMSWVYPNRIFLSPVNACGFCIAIVCNIVHMSWGKFSVFVSSRDRIRGTLLRHTLHSMLSRSGDNVVGQPGPLLPCCPTERMMCISPAIQSRTSMSNARSSAGESLPFLPRRPLACTDLGGPCL